MKDNNDVSLIITKTLIRDIYGRYGLEQYIRSLHPSIQLKMYEDWHSKISLELYQKSIIETIYNPIDVDSLSLAKIIEEVQKYF